MAFTHRISSQGASVPPYNPRLSRSLGNTGSSHQRRVSRWTKDHLSALKRFQNAFQPPPEAEALLRSAYRLAWKSGIPPGHDLELAESLYARLIYIRLDKFGPQHNEPYQFCSMSSQRARKFYAMWDRNLSKLLEQCMLRLADTKDPWAVNFLYSARISIKGLEDRNAVFRHDSIPCPPNLPRTLIFHPDIFIRHRGIDHEGLQVSHRDYRDFVQVVGVEGNPKGLLTSEDRILGDSWGRISSFVRWIPSSEEEWAEERIRTKMNTKENIIALFTKVSSLASDFDLSSLERHPHGIITVLVLSLSKTLCKCEGDEGDKILENFLIKIRECADFKARQELRAATVHFIGLLERLFAKAGHRAFEGILCHAALDLSFIRDYSCRVDLYDCFDQNQHRDEIQALLPLYPPFLVHLARPDIEPALIREALGAALFSDEAFFKVKAKAESQDLHTDGQIAPSSNSSYYPMYSGYEPPDYDPVWDTTLNDTVRAESFPTEAPKGPFGVFPIPHIIQKTISYAHQTRNGCLQQKVRSGNAVFFFYDENASLREAENQVAEYITHCGIISDGGVCMNPCLCHHHSGATQPEKGYFMVVIPAAAGRHVLCLTEIETNIQTFVSLSPRSGLWIPDSHKYNPPTPHEYLWVTFPTTYLDDWDDCETNTRANGVDPTWVASEPSCC